MILSRIKRADTGTTVDGHNKDKQMIWWRVMNHALQEQELNNVRRSPLLWSCKVGGSGYGI